MTVPSRELGWESVPCVSQILQLAVNKGSAKLAVLQLYVGKLVGHLKHSSVALTALKEK